MQRRTMVTIKVNGKSIDIPSSWDDVTVQQYREMDRCSHELNSARLLSILAGIDYDILINFDCSQFDEKVLMHLDFMHEIPDWENLPKPTHLTIGGVQYKVPESIQSTTWFQRTMMKTLAVEGVEKSMRMTELIAPALTYMMQPVLDGKVNDKRFEEVQMIMDKLPIKQAYPLASFFLSTYLIYSPKKANT